ncbi:MAG: signal peptidase I [Spirochaetales bacterium]|nr:signal peptidase I [Spirochaetales bacterium]
MRKFLLTIICLSLIIFGLFFDIIKVSGNSMLPDIHNGDIAVIRRNRLTKRETSVGDIVIFVNPVTEQLNIKKCTALYGDTIFVTGTNLPESTDSRAFGRITKNSIKGWLWINI